MVTILFHCPILSSITSHFLQRGGWLPQLFINISAKRCKECSGAACDDDSIVCNKCKKPYHWDCSPLSDYQKKQYKKNPYKPWRCDACIEKYCIHCNKIVSNEKFDLDCICCDKCSYWFHQSCSQLDDTKFKKYRNNPDELWTCPPCKQKLCVRCSISTFNKPKTSCCLCLNLYHNVCAGLPKSKNMSSSWLCTTCRPTVFPFHNVDKKGLDKLKTSSDRYSLESLNLLAINLSQKCSICLKKLSKNNPGVPCFCCNSKIHTKCSKLSNPSASFQSFKGNWQCDKCMKDKFPFFEIDNDILQELFDNPDAKKGRFAPEFSVDDKLKLLLSCSSTNNWYAHVCDDELDPRDREENKPNFHYYDINDFRKTQQIWDRQKSLSIFHTNIGSLQSNFGKMEDLLGDMAWEFDIVAVSETRNDKKNLPHFSPPLMPGYRPYVGTPGSSQNGGCGFYIHNSLSPTPRPDLEFKIEDIGSECESCWLELISDNSPNTIVGVIYRHPSKKNPEKFLTMLEGTLKKLKKENKKTIICGDFNLNLLDIDMNKNVSIFLCSMLEHNFHPHITEPTRITNTNRPSLVDNIFTNTFENPMSGNILEHVSYDHLPNFVILDHVKKKKLDNTHKRDKKNFNASKFNDELLGEDLLVNLLNAQDTDTAYNIFHNKYRTLLDKHAPLRKLTKKELKRKEKPWITQGLIKSISKKRSLFVKFKKLKFKNSNTEEVFRLYKHYNDTINKLKRKCKRDYYQNYFTKNSSNSKKVWCGINQLLNRGRKKQGTIFLEENGLISDPLQVANKFNKYYLNIADKLCEKIPKVNNKFQDFLKNPNKNKLTLNETTPDEIMKIINDLDGKKSGDIFHISPDLVKLSGQTLSQILTIIFNFSIKDGCFPAAMKPAKILPMHKGDSVLAVGNYRPISILPILSKIFERLIYNRLIKFINDNNILTELQFGFQKNKSTEHAVTSILSTLDEAKFKGNSSYCIFLDFAKAFDTVNHEILLKKLDHYGVSGISHNLLKSYLSNRSQQTEINGVLSDSGVIKHGVPQGSVLGPLLFLIYINDIRESSEVLKFFLFADDTTVFYSDKTNAGTEDLLNRELSKVSTWLAANKLSLNVKKSNFLHFHHGKVKKPTINLRLNETAVEEKSVTKYLGVFIDNKLTWKTHIQHVKTKLSQGNGMISKIRYYVNDVCLRNLFYSFVQSHINYNLINWSSTYPTLINAIGLKVKAAVRLISFKNKYEHTNPLFLKHKILPLLDLIKYKKAILLWKISKGYINEPLSTIFDRNTYNPLRYNLPNPQRTSDKYKIVYSCVKYWNSIPRHIRNASTLNSFNERHKKHLLSQLASD